MYKRQLLLGLLASCSGDAIRDAARETAASSFGVMGVHPPAGAAGLRGDLVLSVVFGERPPRQALDVRMSTSAREWLPPCQLDESGHWMTCAPMRDVPLEQVFDIEFLRPNGDVLMLSVASELPEDPRAYRLEDIRVTRFGATRTAAEQISDLIDDSTIIAVTEGGELSDGKHTLRMGLADSYGAEVSVRPPGLTMVYDMVLRNRIGGPPQNVFLPLQILSLIHI